MTLAICRVEPAEIDEMQSFVGKKGDPRGLWHAIDPDRGDVLGYTLGSREERLFLELKRLLEPF
ncbi:MAG: IS1 family transposase [Candidatus Poribacteria bacterium]|nr:IS1 family transposase [Candidatus Poribacteria bacterium]